MSAPVIGDRVRVIAGQWTGWEGYVAHTYDFNRWLVIDLIGEGAAPDFIRTLHGCEVEKVPTEPTDGHRGDETGADVETDPDAGIGAQIGGKR